MNGKHLINLKEWSALISSILTIISVCISLFLLYKVNNISEWIDQTVDPIDLSIIIDRPKNDSTYNNCNLLISGNVELGCKKYKTSKIGTELRRRNISIVPIVLPLSGTKILYPQHEVIVDDNGKFSGAIQIGDVNYGNNISYIVRVVAVHSSMKENPTNYASSSECTIVHRNDK